MSLLIRVCIRCEDLPTNIVSCLPGDGYAFNGTKGKGIMCHRRDGLMRVL